MALASLTWPEASVYIAAIAVGGLVVAVLNWSIFRTGQTAIRSEGERQARPVGADQQSPAPRPSLASARSALTQKAPPGRGFLRQWANVTFVSPSG